jgi:hypothetical protein
MKITVTIILTGLPAHYKLERGNGVDKNWVWRVLDQFASSRKNKNKIRNDWKNPGR